MTSPDWDFITSVFNRALELPESERVTLIDRECAGRDPSIREEILEMLRAEQQSRGFLETEQPELLTVLPGGWKVLDKLGEGGMGAVYRVSRTIDGVEQFAAAKLLPPLHGPTPELARRLRAEHRILANLEHPNITRILDGGALHEAPYFIMELVDGEPLMDYIGSRTISTRERLELFLKICGGIRYAHQRLVVHRDIKPSNILITQDGEPKILDFGIAKALAPDPDRITGEDNTATVYRAASLHYASPEQLRGQAVSTASDIYSLGVLLFEVLTGTRRPLPDAQTPEAAIRQAETTPLPKASSIKSSVSKDLDAIIGKATRIEPDDRYASVDQLTLEIDRYLKGLPVEAREGAWRYVTSKYLLRNRYAVAGVLLLMSLVGAYVIQSRRAELQLRETSELAGLLAIQMPARQNSSIESLRFRRKVAAYGFDYLNERRIRNEWGPAQLALGYFNLANTFGAPEQISLGEFPRAAQCYRTVIDLLWDGRPNEGPLRNALSLSMIRLPRVYLRMRKPAGAAELAKECIDKASSMPSSNGVRRLLANCRFTLAMARADLEKPEPELAAAAAVEILQTLGSNEDPDIAPEPLSAAANRASAVSLRLKRHQDVIRYARLSQDAAARETVGPESQLMYGIAFRNAANGYIGLHQNAEARSAFTEAIRLLRELSHQEPDDIQSRAFLSQALIEYSTLQEAEPPARMASLREAVNTLRGIVDGSRYPIARALMARAFDEQAELIAASNPQSACELRNQARREYDSMALEGVLLPAERAHSQQVAQKACK